MATSKASITVCCPFHPSELIQRVSINFDTTQQLYCTECVLQLDDPHMLSSNLRSINDLIDTAAGFYQARKDKAKISEEVPTDYSEPLSRQAEYVDKLSKHIEEEKKKVTNLFDQLTKDTIRILEDKKHEYLSELDQQLFNLRYWYIFLDKQVKKAYPTEEDISFLFPSKEDLTNKLQKLSNFTQLMAFVRNIKEDLAENKSIVSRVDSKMYLKMLTEDLVKVENTKPVYKMDHTVIPDIKEGLKKVVERSMPQLLLLEGSIPDVARGRDFQSKIMNSAGFNTLKKWMPQGDKLNLQLLYRASQNGKTAKSFHDFCDGKGPTITIAKCRFMNSTTDSIIGGYSDKDWNQSGSYSSSSQAFLFSITRNVKCMVHNPQRAVFGRSNNGPNFGGQDLALLTGDKTNSIKPKCYTDTKMLVDMPNYVGGQAQFDLIDLEVFRVL